MDKWINELRFYLSNITNTQNILKNFIIVTLIIIKFYINGICI